MDCACLVHKGVYLQLIRSTTRRYFRERQHGPAWKCIYPKNKPTKNARYHENLTKRTSERHTTRKSYKFQEKIALPFILKKNVGKAFNFCWRSKEIVEPKSAPQNIDFWGSCIIFLASCTLFVSLFITSPNVRETVPWNLVVSTFLPAAWWGVS